MITDPNGGNYLIGTTTTPAEEGEPSYSNTAFVSKLDTEGGEEWSIIVLPESRIQEEGETDNSRDIIIVALIISILVSGGYYRRILSLRSRKVEQLLLNKNMTKILSPIFHNQPQLIHIFGATKVFSDKKTSDEIRADIPSEILHFKYFLHPVRLSIVKLLDENMHLTTVQIRESLDITWSELSTHLGSLKKRGYIAINQEFIDGSTRS